MLIPSGATHYLLMADHVFYVKYKKSKPFIYERHTWLELRSTKYEIKPL